MKTFYAFLLSIFITTPALACYEQAANAYNVDKNLLLAIAYIESRWKPDAININKNGSEDLCAFQINDFHLPSIATYGIDRDRLLTDLCACAYVGAWILTTEIRRENSIWGGVANYHTGPKGNRERRDWYVGNVQRVYDELTKRTADAGSR